MVPQYNQHLDLTVTWTFFCCESNRLCASRNKYAQVQLIILDELSMVFKKVCYQTHRRVIETFNLANLLFANRSTLADRKFSQLLPADETVA